MQDSTANHTKIVLRKWKFIETYQLKIENFQRLSHEKSIKNILYKG